MRTYLGTPSCAIEFWKTSTNELKGSEDSTTRETIERLLKNDLINASRVRGVVEEDDIEAFPLRKISFECFPRFGFSSVLPF